MGCNSDYLDPTASEEESQRAAMLLKYVFESKGMPVPSEVEKAANDSYGDVGRLNTFVVKLCALLTNMSAAEQDAIIYNGRNPKARQLADWWDEHQAADRQRLAQEAEDKRRAKLRASALAKLTPDELAALTEQWD